VLPRRPIVCITNEFHAHAHNMAIPPVVSRDFVAPDFPAHIAISARSFHRRASDDENRRIEIFRLLNLFWRDDLSKSQSSVLMRNTQFAPPREIWTPFAGVWRPGSRKGMSDVSIEINKNAMENKGLVWAKRQLCPTDFKK
jgi:hypothetical protein